MKLFGYKKRIEKKLDDLMIQNKAILEIFGTMLNTIVPILPEILKFNKAVEKLKEKEFEIKK